MKKAKINLGWSQGKNSDVDLDLVLFLAKSITDDSYVVKNDDHMIYYNQLCDPNSCVELSPDNRTGISKSGIAEYAVIDFNSIDESYPQVDTVMVMVVLTETDVEGNLIPETKMTQTFGMLESSIINVTDETQNTECGSPSPTCDVVCEYTIHSQYQNNISLHVGNFRKLNDTWAFDAIGTGFNLNLYSISNMLKVPSFM